MVKFNCTVLFFICPLIYFAQQVNNVEASQLGQNIVVTYDLESEQPCTINLFISTNGGTTWQGPLKQVQGQVGPNIKSGQNSITLFVLNEFNELRGDNIRFKVDALTNNLNTIKIGNQTWATRNLNLETYRNGEVIPQVQDANAWANLRTGAWCYYENNTANGSSYGKLYNWYAVNDPRGLAPKGYHIPSDAEWTILSDNLGDEASGRILVELPCVKDKARVRELLQGTANLEFWETYENGEIAPLLDKANIAISNYLNGNKTTKTASVNPQDTAIKNFIKRVPLFSFYQNAFPLVPLKGRVTLDEKGNPKAYAEGAVVGFATSKSDTAKVNQYLKIARSKNIFPSKLKFMWGSKEVEQKSEDGKVVGSYFELFAIKQTDSKGKAALSGDIITDARKDYDQRQGGVPLISMSMNSEAAQKWKTITGANKGKCVAVVMDNMVYSAPRVNSEISGGQSQITGNFTDTEADALAAILSAGTKMKSSTGWQNNGNGNNTSGFAGLPGGYRDSNGDFSSIGADGSWWSSSEDGASFAWYRSLDVSSGNVDRGFNYKRDGFSVRCLRD